MFHERWEAGELNKEEILNVIEKEFDRRTMKIVKYQINVVDAMAMYHKLKAENKYTLDEILAKLEEEGFTDEGVLRFVCSKANESAAMTMYQSNYWLGP